MAGIGMLSMANCVSMIRERKAMATRIPLTSVRTCSEEPPTSTFQVMLRITP